VDETDNRFVQVGWPYNVVVRNGMIRKDNSDGRIWRFPDNYPDPVTGPDDPRLGPDDGRVPTLDSYHVTPSEGLRAPADVRRDPQSVRTEARGFTSGRFLPPSVVRNRSQRVGVATVRTVEPVAVVQYLPVVAAGTGRPAEVERPEVAFEPLQPPFLFLHAGPKVPKLPEE
jgi:hypothetical protein